jgi:CelD/BcsL family acetyltransferase involved in cellulose biosynthesis
MPMDLLSGTSGSLLKFRILRSLDDLSDIERHWRDLENSASKTTNLFQTFDWCWNWCAAREEDPDSPWSIMILTGWNDGRLLLIWPLALTRPGILNVREAHWLGDPLTQYGDIIIAQNPASDAWIVEAWKAFLAQPDIDLLYLRKVRADAAIASFLDTQAYNLPGSQSAPAIDLTRFKDWQDLDASAKRKHRKDRARYRRRFREIGTLHFEMFEPGIVAQQSARQALLFKKTWLKKYGHTSGLVNERTEDLLLRLARGGQKPVQCLVSVLYLDREPIAVEIGFGWKKYYYAHIGTYNPWFSKFGPGRLLMEEVVQALMARSFETYDLLAPADHYKHEWSNIEVGVRDHALPVTLRGVTHMGLYLKVIRPGMKSIYENLPTPVRNQLNRFAESA